VRAAALWSPVTDLRAVPALRDEVRALTGDDPAVIRAASPIEHVSSRACPVVSFTGTDDELVPVATVRAFHRALDDAGVKNVLVEYPGAGHAFDFEPVRWTDSFDRAVAFLDEVLGAPPTMAR
jgi:acetyl esterase/lipase